MQHIVMYRAIVLGVLLGLCGYGGPVQARVISIDFTAKVTEASGLGGALRNLKVGDTIAGTYFYDSTTPNGGGNPPGGIRLTRDSKACRTKVRPTRMAQHL